jgi:hypothetical protein
MMKTLEQTSDRTTTSFEARISHSSRGGRGSVATILRVAIIASKAAPVAERDVV